MSTSNSIKEVTPPVEHGPAGQPIDAAGPHPEHEPPVATAPQGARTHALSDPQFQAGIQRPQSHTGFVSDYDGPVRASSMRSQRPLRFASVDNMREEDDYYYGNNGPNYNYPYHYHPPDRSDSFRDDGRHPDRFGRRPSQTSRPPRAYMNRQYNFGRDGAPSPNSMGTKTLFEERYSAEEVPHHQQRPPPQPQPQRPPYRPEASDNSRIKDEEMGYDWQNGNIQRLQWKNLTEEEKAEVLRLPFTRWMHSDFKNHFVASLGEFVGTTLFLLIAFAGTEVANIQSQAAPEGTDSNTTTGATTGFDVSVLMYISIIFGFSLMVNVWIFFRISGGLFNPAVTLAMLMVRAISPKRATWLFVAQMLGSMLASVIVRFLLPQAFNVKTTLSNGTSIIQGVFIEAILTAELVFTIFMLAKEKHRSTFIAPVGIGLALFIAEMVGVQFTGGSLNPARSFGPCVITASFDPEHWIYWVGPFIGALIAVAFYNFIKTLEYEMANPGADGDPLNDPTVNPEKLLELKHSRTSVPR